jgi:hypothetical protein
LTFIIIYTISNYNTEKSKGAVKMVQTTRQSGILEKLNNLPEVEYPVEIVERWVKEGDVALAQYATGELMPMNLAEFAAEHGLVLHCGVKN